MADMTMTCAVEDSFTRTEMNACATRELVERAHAETEATARAELPSERKDRTSKALQIVTVHRMGHDPQRGDPSWVRRQFEQLTSKINEKNTRKRESTLDRSKRGENPRICSVKAAKPVGYDPHAAYADGIACARNGGRKRKMDRTLRHEKHSQAKGERTLMRSKGERPPHM